jgi:hypothetical protein
MGCVSVRQRLEQPAAGRTSLGELVHHRHACLVVYRQAWSRDHFDEAAVALVDGSVDDTVDNGPDLGVTRGDLWTPKPPEKNLEKGPIRPLRAV